MRRGVAVTPLETRRDVIVHAAMLADELGYEVFSVAEGWGLDSTVLLAELAAATGRITLVAGVLSIWGRSPATIAMTAATLDRLSGGRFVLGLGASTRQLVEGWHDVGYDRPAARLRDVTTRVRALLNGERSALSAVPAARALRLGQPPVPDLPIWLAATGERTIRVAADLADGWYPLYLRRDRIRELTADVPWQRPVTVAAGPLTVVDPDVTAARAAAAACTTAYLGAMGDVYPRLVAAQGLAAEVDLVRSTRTIPGEAQILLDEFTAYGTAATVREQLELWDATVDLTIVGLPPGLPWPRIEATIRAAAPLASTHARPHRDERAGADEQGDHQYPQHRLVEP
jgi:alkanesulfonate monooxygenase SsuD/methylene tetrahydromethanopterin reductase-like flavin-dependent oxidoreductase (luciferase family)